MRRAKPADAKELAEVFRYSWQHAYCGIIPALHLETIIQRRGFDWWRGALRSRDPVLVLEVTDEVCGYATCGTSRSRGSYEGEIYELYLNPDFQGLGFGEHLFEACRNDLDARNLRGLMVWALAENKPATDFYWRRGGRPIAQTFDRVGGAKLEKIAFAWG